MWPSKNKYRKQKVKIAILMLEYRQQNEQVK